MRRLTSANFLIPLLSFLISQLFHSTLSSPDSKCLDKLCQLESGCNPNEKCLGSGTAHCGPYYLSRVYWKAASSPGNDFESCVFDLDCARTTVSQYLEKYSRDCDGDGQITCVDYIAIQKAGHSNCHEGWVFETSFFKRFMALEGFAMAGDPVPDESFFNETRLTTNSLEIRVRERNPRRDERFRPTRSPRRPYTIVYWPVDDPRLVTEAPRRGTRKPWIISVGDRNPNARPTKPTTTSPGSETVPTRRRSRTRSSTRPTRPMSTRRSRTTERPRSSTSIWTTRGLTSPSPSTSSPAATTYYAPTATVPRVTTTRSTTTTPTTTTTTARPSTTTTATPTPAPTTRPSNVTPRIAPTSTTRNPKTKPTFNPTRTPKLTTAAPPTDWTLGSETDPTTPRKPVTPSRAPNETREVIPFKESCLECICLGSSGCNYQTKCDKDGECGPYKIDYAYWYEAGYPGYEGDEGDFKKCVQSKECAETTVKQYVARYTKDCNDDGMIDCIDYAALHKSGPGECSKQWVYESKFWTTFSDCYGFDFRRR